MGIRIVLAGGGHGHINILKSLARSARGHHEYILISDYRYQYYSGMLPGFLEGIYTEREISFDVEALCHSAGVRFVPDKILSVDAEQKRVETTNGIFPYDFLSMNLGSSPVRALGDLPPNAVYAKPIANLVSASLQIARPDVNNIVVVGAGAAGAELVLSLSATYPEKHFTLVGSERLLPRFSAKTREMFLQILNSRKIEYLTQRVQAVDTNTVYLPEACLPHDFTIVATGVAGPEIHWKGFQVNARNQVIVDDTLRADPFTVAMGDMVQLAEHPNLPMAGVFAIREAPVLQHNLFSLIGSSGETESYSKLKQYIPQQNYLAILNIGHKMAILNRGEWSWKGRIPWVIKDWIDRRYMSL